MCLQCLILFSFSFIYNVYKYTKHDDVHSSTELRMTPARNAVGSSLVVLDGNISTTNSYHGKLIVPSPSQPSTCRLINRSSYGNLRHAGHRPQWQNVIYMNSTIMLHARYLQSNCVVIYILQDVVVARHLMHERSEHLMHERSIITVQNCFLPPFVPGQWGEGVWKGISREMIFPAYVKSREREIAFPTFPYDIQSLTARIKGNDQLSRALEHSCSHSTLSYKNVDLHIIFAVSMQSMWALSVRCSYCLCGCCKPVVAMSVWTL